jgi:hypothetical protein
VIRIALITWGGRGDLGAFKCFLPSITAELLQQVGNLLRIVRGIGDISSCAFLVMLVLKLDRVLLRHICELASSYRVV